MQAVAAVAAPLISLITFFSRSRRLRAGIRDNLALIKELDEDQVLREHSPAALWLRGKVEIDVAKLAGQPIGNPKKPIPWTAIVFAVIFCGGLSFWTYYLDRNQLSWFSLITGSFAFLFAISIYGMFSNRELPSASEERAPVSAAEKADFETIANLSSANGNSDASAGPDGGRVDLGASP